MKTMTNTKTDLQTNYLLTDNTDHSMCQSKVITLNTDNVPLDKNAANEAYVREQGTRLQSEGFHDAVTGGNIIQLESKLMKIKNAYILWCEAHQHLYKREHEDAMERHEELIAKYRNDVVSIEHEMQPLEERASAYRQEIDSISNRDYKLIARLKIMLCLIAWLSLGAWLAVYYGSAFYLTQISSIDMVNTEGEVIRLFTLDNMLQGWPLALFPIAVGILTGFLGNLKKGDMKIFVGEMLLFASLDIALALQIEQRIGEGFAFMGEQHAFNWAQFWLIIMYGTVGAIFFSLAGYKFNQSLLMDDWNTKRTIASETERLLNNVNEHLHGLQKRKDAVTEQLNIEEGRLRKKHNDEIYTHWYNGTTMECLLHEYYDGWRQAIATIPGQSQMEIEQLQSGGLSILRKIIEHS